MLPNPYLSPTCQPPFLPVLLKNGGGAYLICFKTGAEPTGQSRFRAKGAFHGLRYKFYLAFETENCEDYVTEKFFRSLYAGAVPVVMGAPNVWQFAPDNKSYIDVRDFKGPKALGMFLPSPASLLSAVFALSAASALSPLDLPPQI